MLRLTITLSATLWSLLGAPTSAADTVLWNNGPLVNVPFGGPGGAHASTVQTPLGLTQTGYGINFVNPLGTFSTSTQFAEDFVVSAPGAWHVTSISVFALVGGHPHLSVLRGAPWDGGIAIASGSANESSCPQVFRIPATAAPPVQICSWKVDLDVTLTPGRYWLVWHYPTALALGISPPVTINGMATTGDARIRTIPCNFGNCVPNPWLPLTDGEPGTPAQGLPFVVRGAPASAVKGNFDGSESPEIVFRNVNPQSADFGRYSLWRMLGSTRAGATLLPANLPGAEWALVATDDFDTAGAPYNGPDGRTDAVFQHATSGALEIWLFDRELPAGPPVPVTGAAAGPGWVVVAAADFDADARPDLLWRNSSSQQLVIWTMNGSTWTGSIAPVPGQAQHANWQVVAAQDYNADGAIDLLWYNTSSGRIVLWYMDANVVRITGAFTTPAGAGDNNWKVVASADYSGIGPGSAAPHAPDVLWRNADSGRLVLWHLDDAGTRLIGEFTNPASETPALDWQVVGPR
jgi:hypothetical protein